MNRTSRLTAIVRYTVVAAVAGLFAAAWATAGPGNGYQAQPAVKAVTLPTVVVVAHRA